MLEKIVSGAQTGADRGGLDAALAKGVPIGGWVPKGRKAEDGVIPEKYIGLVEMTNASYKKRTEQNVIDSDATLVLHFGPAEEISGGTKKTLEYAMKHGKPSIRARIDLETWDPVNDVNFLRRQGVKVLNVAGPRESKMPGIQAAAERYVSLLIDHWRYCDENNVPIEN